MTKKVKFLKKEPEVKVKEDQLDLLQYTYKDGHKVELVGNIVPMTISLSREIYVKGIQTGVEYDEKASIPELKSRPVKRFITTSGLMALDMLMYLQPLHQENIDKKIAVVNKPSSKTEEVKVTKD